MGHTMRKEVDNTTRHALDWNPQGKIRIRRPKQIWMRSVIDEFKYINLTWEDAKQGAKDRRRWRSTVEALCFPRLVS